MGLFIQILRMGRLQKMLLSFTGYHIYLPYIGYHIYLPYIGYQIYLPYISIFTMFHYHSLRILVLNDTSQQPIICSLQMPV